VHDSETGRFEASKAYVGDLPLPCIELCAEDLHCHGFVTFESACYFRAGKAKSAERKRIRNASRDWQRLPDDPSPRPKTKSKDLDVNPGSDPVPAGAADKARFHVDNRPTAMDEPTLMARLAGNWMPWFLMCTPKSRSSSTRARPSSSTSPRPSTSQTVPA